MTTAPKLEPRELARKYLASAPGKFALTKGEWAEICRALLSAPSAGLREDNALTPRIETKVVPIHASPGHDGELGLEWEHGGLFFGIEITAKGDATWIIRRDSKFELGGQTWVPGMRPDIEWARTVVDRLDADSTPAMKAKQPDTRGDSALLTLSKEGGSALTPHQTNAHDE